MEWEKMLCLYTKNEENKSKIFIKKQKGVRQGENLSPFLSFSIFINDIEDFLFD